MKLRDRIHEYGTGEESLATLNKSKAYRKKQYEFYRKYLTQEEFDFVIKAIPGYLIERVAIDMLSEALLAKLKGSSIEKVVKTEVKKESNHRSIRKKCERLAAFIKPGEELTFSINHFSIMEGTFHSKEIPKYHLYKHIALRCTPLHRENKNYKRSLFCDLIEQDKFAGVPLKESAESWIKTINELRSQSDPI